MSFKVKLDYQRRFFQRNKNISDQKSKTIRLIDHDIRLDDIVDLIVYATPISPDKKKHARVK